MSPFNYIKVSTKLKQIRKVFSITQYSFSKFGINQHYISMIESDKRSPSSEMVEAIYNALFEITQGEVTNFCTKEQFCMTLEEQATNWINTYFDNIEKLVAYYPYCINELKKYNLYNQIYGIYERLANYYSEIADHKKAHKFYLSCIESAIRNNISPIQTYIKIGKLMQYQSEYKQALIYYLLALDDATDDDLETYYQIQLLIAEMYYKSGEFDNSFSVVGKILASCQISKFLAGAKIIEGLIFYEFKNYELSIQCFQSVLSDLKYEPYFGFAYYGIALYLTNEKNYVESIATLEQARHYTNDPREDLIYLLLLSINYYYLKNYTKAMEYSLEAQTIKTNKTEYSIIKEWYVHTVTVLCALKDEKQLLMLLQHAKECQPKELAQELKFQYLDYLTLAYKDTPDIFYKKVVELSKY